MKGADEMGPREGGKIVGVGRQEGTRRRGMV